MAQRRGGARLATQCAAAQRDAEGSLPSAPPAQAGGARVTSALAQRPRRGGAEGGCRKEEQAFSAPSWQSSQKASVTLRVWGHQHAGRQPCSVAPAGSSDTACLGTVSPPMGEWLGPEPAPARDSVTNLGLHSLAANWGSHEPLLRFCQFARAAHRAQGCRLPRPWELFSRIQRNSDAELRGARCGRGRAQALCPRGAGSRAPAQG